MLTSIFRPSDDYKNGISKTNSTVMGISICNCNSEGGTSRILIAGSTITGYSIYFDTDDAEFTGLNPVKFAPTLRPGSICNSISGFAASAVTDSGTKVALDQIPNAGGPIFQEDNSPSRLLIDFGQLIK